MKLDGTNWTDVSSDVKRVSNVSSGMGINKDSDRVANIGFCSLVMKNDTSNSAGLLGYYSPGNANCRTGFDIALPVRIRFLFDNLYWINWTGEIIPDGIKVVPGIYGAREVTVTCNDWMYHAVNHEIITLSYTTSKRADEGIVLVNSNMLAQPDSTSLDVGTYTFPSIFSLLRKGTTAISEFQKFAMSERGYIYLKNGALVFENRTHRDSLAAVTVVALPSSLCESLLDEEGNVLLDEEDNPLLEEGTISVSFNNTMCEMVPEGRASNLFNKVVYTVYPQEEFSGTLGLTQSRIALEAGETKTGFVLNYRDPTGGAPSVSMKTYTTPVSNTDYKMSANLDGTGTDLIANLTATFNIYANNATVDLQNTGATKGYVYLQVRGTGLRNYDKVSKITESTTSQALYKQKRVLTIDAPYQNDPVVADTYASLILNLHKTPRSTTKTISYYTNSDTNRCYFLGLGIGSKIPVTETVTGINENYFIQNITWDLVGYNQSDGAIIKVTYLLKLARMDVFEFAEWDTANRGWESDYGWAE